MNPAYWNVVADDYDREVLSVFENDTAGLVSSRIIAAGGSVKAGTAADLGCGVGKFTPLLAENFAQVEACDCSGRGLELARERCTAFPNINFHKLDICSDPMPFAPVDFVLCVNVLIMPSLDERLRAWRTVTNQVVRGGTILLVVPSLESVHLRNYQAVEACLEEGDTCAEAIRRCLPKNAATGDMHMGVHTLEGLPTKHYFQEELEQLLPTHEFDASEIVKLTYGEKAADGPPWPWDWLVVGSRR